MSDDFSSEDETPTDLGDDLRLLLGQTAALLGQISPQLSEVLANIKKLSQPTHPAFEWSRLDELNRLVRKQQESTTDLRALFHSLHHDAQWIRKHVGELKPTIDALNKHLIMLGVAVDQPKKED